MKYTFEDFVSPQQEPEPLPATERKILEKQIADLREQVETYRREIDQHFHVDWFRRHVSQLCDEAAKKFPEALVREHLEAAAVHSQLQALVEKAVVEAFEKEGQELGRAIYQAVMQNIQPYCLKRKL